MTDCTHANCRTYEVEGETWVDSIGKSHTVHYVKCSCCGRTIRVWQS